MFEEVKNVVIWMEILGIPTIFGLTSWCVNQCICFKRKLDILMKAQKAQMRAQLLKDYYFYEKQGWISDIEMKEWQNQYNAYHELVGENGVLDDRYRKLLNLPNREI